MNEAGLTSNIDITSVDAALRTLIQTGIHFGVKLMTAILIFVFGMWLANRLTKSVARMMDARKFDLSLRSFLLSFINIVSKIFVVVIVLTTVGVQMTSIVAVLGGAALAVGLALQGTLQNFAGGIVILVFKPFRVGDTIVTPSGQTGVVKRIIIFTTELHTFDNQVVFLPNGSLANGVITNLSNGKQRRTDLQIGISYGDSVPAARKVILDVLAKDARVMKTPEPSVFVSELGDSAVVLNVRYWTTFNDMYAAMADITEQIYEALPKKKINFPFPQMDVHIVK